MRYSTILSIAAAGLMFVATFEPARAADAEAQPSFVRLYNEKNLDGWEVQDGDKSAWVAEGELLSCVKEGGGWLRSAKKYSDFVLKMEYRIPAGGNSGVGIRFPDKGNPAFDGIEIQILDDDAAEYKNLKDSQYNGGLYYEAAAKRGAAKPPGEWNKFEITCLGRRITVALNGKVINDVDLDKYTEKRNEASALADRPEYGHIGMQSHGSRVDFRNIELKDLTTTTDSGVIYSDVKEGDGELVLPDSRVKVHYTGRLVDGSKFESSRDGEPVSVRLADVKSGWQHGTAGMKAGGRRKIIVPPELTFGTKGSKSVPRDAAVVFDVEILDVE